MMGTELCFMTAEETEDFRRCEAVIEGGLRTFVDVGMALTKIRDERLYRESHGTFEDYCLSRWDIARNYANKVIAAAEVVGNLGTTVPILPTSERQARPLASLPAPQQAEAWTRAVESAPNGKPTAKQVEAAVAEITGKLKPAPADDDTEEDAGLRDPDTMPEMESQEEVGREEDAEEEAEEKADDQEIEVEEDEERPAPTPPVVRTELFGPGENGPTVPESRAEFQKWNARLGRLLTDINAVACGIADNEWIVPATLTKQDRNNLKVAENNMKDLREAADEFIRKLRAIRCEK